MALTKSKKRLLLFLSFIVIIVLIGIFSINFILASIITGKVEAALEKNKSEYQVKIGDVGGNIFFGNIRLKDITVKPDSSLLSKLKDGQVASGSVYDIELPLFRIAGLGLYNAIVSGIIDIRKIEFKRGDIKIYKGPIPDLPKVAETPKKPATFKPDSIYLKGVNGVSIGALILSDNKIQVIDIESNEVINQNKISLLELTDFFLVKQDTGENVFKLVMDDFKLQASKELFNLPGGDYNLGFKNLEFTMSDRTLTITEFKLKPTFKDKYKMAAQWKYTKEIFDLTVKEIKVHHLDTYKLVTERAIFIDSISVDGIRIDILKDKRYPFDESKRPKLPHELLRTMEIPLYVGQINISKGNLKYQEKEESASELMTVTLNDLNINVSFATSVPDSTRTGKPMKINLRAKLMNKPELKVDLVMPLNSRVDTFYFAGSLGPAKLSVFDKATVPALGAKFIKGKLNSLNFKGSGNTHVSKGEFTMLYKDLEGELSKKDDASKNKFMSWAANSILRAGNPGKNGKTRVAVMGYNRDMYKGFPNFLWKTLQSGITNTIIPAGKKVKEDKTKTKGIKQENPVDEKPQKKKRSGKKNKKE